MGVEQLSLHLKAPASVALQVLRVEAEELLQTEVVDLAGEGSQEMERGWPLVWTSWATVWRLVVGVAEEEIHRLAEEIAAVILHLVVAEVIQHLLREAVAVSQAEGPE